jgi:hypothetical protein
MGAAWIIVGLVVIAALYALLFATADSLHAAEQRRAGAVPTPGDETDPRTDAASTRH